MVKNGLGSGSSGGERGAVITGVVGGRLQSSVSLCVAYVCEEILFGGDCFLLNLFLYLTFTFTALLFKK